MHYREQHSERDTIINECFLLSRFQNLTFARNQQRMNFGESFTSRDIKRDITKFQGLTYVLKNITKGFTGEPAYIICRVVTFYQERLFLP